MPIRKTERGESVMREAYVNARGKKKGPPAAALDPAEETYLIAALIFSEITRGVMKMISSVRSLIWLVFLNR